MRFKSLFAAAVVASALMPSMASASYQLGPRPTMEEREAYDRQHTAINDFHQNKRASNAQNSVQMKSEVSGTVRGAATKMPAGWTSDMISPDFFDFERSAAR